MNLVLAMLLCAASPAAKINSPSSAMAGGVAEVSFSVADTTDWAFECEPKPSWMKRYPDKEKGEITVVIHSETAVEYSLRLILVVDGKLRQDRVELRFVSPVNTTPVAVAGRLMGAEAEAPVEMPSATAQFTYRLAKEMARVEPDSKARLQKEAQIVADVLRDGRAKVIERRIETFEELERFTAQTCLNNLGRASFEAWKVDFLEELSAHLDELSAAGSLTIMQHYADTWLEAAKGLEKFAK